MFPTAALVDAHVLRTLPPKLVAYTGVDALTHAVEAALCRPGVANAVSDVLAEDAVAGIFAHLRTAFGAADDEAGDAARAGCMHASTLAGFAFGNADVGAVHCLSETIGGIWDVPHGLGNAVFLAPTLRHHLAMEDLAARSSGGASERRVRRRLTRLAARVAAEAPEAMHRAGVGAAPSAEAFLSAVDALIRDLQIPPFSSLRIAKAEHPRIAAMSVANGSNGSNPGDLGVADYMRIIAVFENTRAIGAPFVRDPLSCG